jgi:hypothetical protein
MIWGRSKEGELVTLFKCQSAGMTIGSVSTESYIVSSVFVSKNAWFTPGEDITFTSLTLQYMGLAEWVGISGFQPGNLNEFKDFIEGKEVKIVYKRPSDLQPINVGDYTLSIRFRGIWPSIGPSLHKATIEQHTSIFIEPRDSREILLHDAFVLARGIQNFLSLMMYDNPIYPLVMEGQVKIEEKTSEKEPNATMRLLYVPLETKKPTEKITRNDIVFSYDDVADIWESALNKMVIVEDGKLKAAFNDFFAEYFTPPEFTEDRFMAILRALEALQRQTRVSRYYMSEEEYRETLLKKFNEQIDKALLNGDINENFHESLKRRLSCGYQYSLGARLDDLFTVYGTEFLALFVGKNKNDFIRQIVATYNWLTHSDPEYRKDALDRGGELAFLNLRLQLFMVALLLGYVGVPLEKIADMFNDYKFHYLRIPNPWEIQET